MYRWSSSEKDVQGIRRKEANRRCAWIFLAWSACFARWKYYLSARCLSSLCSWKWRVCFWQALKRSRQMACSVWELASVSDRGTRGTENENRETSTVFGLFTVYSFRNIPVLFTTHFHFKLNSDRWGGRTSCNGSVYSRVHKWQCFGWDLLNTLTTF